MLAGGVVGFLLSVPLGMLSAAPPGIGRGAAWDCRWRRPPWRCCSAGFETAGCRGGCRPSGVAVLLVDLLAAGGIGLPSVAGTFWLLLALGLQGEQPRGVAVGWAPGRRCGVAIALAVACYGTAYSPVLGCQAQLRLAEREPARAVEHLEAAAAADPLCGRALAAVGGRRVRGAGGSSRARRPSTASSRPDAKALRLGPQFGPGLAGRGRLVLPGRLARRIDTGRRLSADAIGKAVAAYRQAVRLYPNSALYRAKLAEACRAAGDQSAFRREAEAALRLDQHHPPHRQETPAPTCASRLLRGLGENAAERRRSSSRWRRRPIADKLMASNDYSIENSLPMKTTLLVTAGDCVSALPWASALPCCGSRRRRGIRTLDESVETPRPAAAAQRADAQGRRRPDRVRFRHARHGSQREPRFRVHQRRRRAADARRGGTSCRCTMSKLGQEKIPPGGSTKVTVTWKPIDKPGPYQQTAKILTNDPARPQVTLTISGRITAAVQLSPAGVGVQPSVGRRDLDRPSRGCCVISTSR